MHLQMYNIADRLTHVVQTRDHLSSYDHIIDDDGFRINVLAGDTVFEMSLWDRTPRYYTPV
jgi:hypothetical protein